MDKPDIIKQLNSRIEQNRRRLNSHRLTAGTKKKIYSETMAMNTAVEELNNNQHYWIVNGFLCTHRVKVKLL